MVACLTRMHVLAHLPLQAWLPPGPYLRSLETLLLSANRLAQVGCLRGCMCRHFVHQQP